MRWGRNNSRDQFDRHVTPHLDSAYNLARWMVGNPADAEDAVQEACVRAFRSLPSRRGRESRAWVLTIVRNVCCDRLRQARRCDPPLPLEDARLPNSMAQDPLSQLLQSESRERLAQWIEELPAEFREALVLREMENLSYQEIAGIVGAPIGTVMSRLARARQRLKQRLSMEEEEANRELW